MEGIPPARAFQARREGAVCVAGTRQRSRGPLRCTIAAPVFIPGCGSRHEAFTRLRKSLTAILSTTYTPPPPRRLFPARYHEIGEEIPPKRILTMIETNETPEPNEAPAKKPISEAKLLANRRNGALSHGPVTAEGRRRSSLNAYRNGLNGQIVCSSPGRACGFQVLLFGDPNRTRPCGRHRKVLRKIHFGEHVQA